MYDRDGNWLMTCVKGDPYIMDMYHTNGHNALVTGAQWHPTAANTIITCGNDGTVRVWDLLNPKTTFDKEICNKQVVRVKNAGGTRLPVTACAYSPAGKHIVVGGEVSVMVHEMCCESGLLLLWCCYRTDRCTIGMCAQLPHIHHNQTDSFVKHMEMQSHQSHFNHCNHNQHQGQSYSQHDLMTTLLR